MKPDAIGKLGEIRFDGQRTWLCMGGVEWVDHLPVERPPTERWDSAIGSLVIKETGEWIVSVTPMLFNDRVLLTHEQEYPRTITAEWCYGVPCTWREMRFPPFRINRSGVKEHE